ncbi:hypothetical protein M413DRAFT_440405 [Hebeloma cylindrosporum]|uniref:Cytochrome c oxidase assembly protein COX20, mitochondrial n=1 Tax=Hebeloma cylindrosporum TaxID=76867 RepID=A0A0C3CRW9_HEBCY|nr:hypothetical protein M413DRAFT_440405 [Hebeloma cylindrosporum h7]
MSTDAGSPSQPPTLPSRVPPPTGNIVYDSLQSAKHVTELPCARNALLAGIVSGAGMGVIRGMAAGPLMAGNWAVGTFALISLGSWHICQKQFADERRKLAQVIEAMPKRTIKENGAQPSSPAGNTPSS